MIIAREAVLHFFYIGQEDGGSWGSPFEGGGLVAIP